MNTLFRTGSGSLILLLLLSACSTVTAPTNQPITQIDESSGYRRLNRDQTAELGDTLVLLAFSGGGTRASALSFGVMQELRDTLIDGRDGQVRLLDEVDTISSVSGGSFTAAYYGVFRDQLFEDFEDDFLRRGVQGALIKQLFNPAHWWRSAFNGFDRTEILRVHAAHQPTPPGNHSPTDKLQPQDGSALLRGGQPPWTKTRSH